jgi:translation initiation factor IF-1
MYRVRLADGRVVRAGLATAARHSIVRLIGGNKVEVRLSSHDRNRGQIVKKLD